MIWVVNKHRKHTKINVYDFVMLSFCSIYIFNWLNEERLWTQYLFSVFYCLYTKWQAHKETLNGFIFKDLRMRFTKTAETHSCPSAYFLSLVCVWDVDPTRPGEKPRHTSPQWHFPAAPWGSQVSRPERMYNPCSEFWICPRIFSQ